MLFGAHCSGGIKGALDRATEIGADAVQLFAQSPRDVAVPRARGGGSRALPRAAARRRGSAPCSCTRSTSAISRRTDRTIYAKSRATMRSTVDTACAIEADGVVFHVGSHLGAGLRRRASSARVPGAAGGARPLLRPDLAPARELGRRGRHDRPLDRRAGDPRRRARPPPAARRLPRLVPSVRVGRRRRRPRHRRRASSPTSTRGSGSTGCARCTSTTRRRRSARTATGTRTCSKASSASGSAPSSRTRPSRSLPAVMETPGPDGHGPDASEMQKLRDLHERGGPPDETRCSNASGRCRRRRRPCSTTSSCCRCSNRSATRSRSGAWRSG